MKAQLLKSYYESHFKRMVLLARKYVGDLDIAQDLVQDIFVRLIQKEPEDITNADAYFFTATKRKCLDYLKIKSIHSDHQQEILNRSAKEYYEDTLEQAELEAYVMGLIDALPEKCQKIFRESRFTGKSNAEIAAEMSISKRTVETQISKALKRIRIGLESYKTMIFTFL